MTRNTGRLLSTCIVTLCVALTVAFVQASAASVVNAVQHHSDTVAEHGHIVFSAVVVDHDHHQGKDGLHPGVASDDGVDQDARVAHHHHSDSPTAGLVSVPCVTTALAAGGERLLLGPNAMVRKVGSPGPERPPSPVASRV